MDCITTYSKGFICSGGSGTLHIFEKTDDKYIYRKTRTVSVWIDPNSNYVATTGADSVPNDILSMTLSPSEENVVCSTRTQQLYNLTLSAADLQGKVGYAWLTQIHLICSTALPTVYTFLCSWGHVSSKGGVLISRGFFLIEG